MVLIEAGLAYNKTSPLFIVSWSSSGTSSQNLITPPIVIEEPVEELLPDEEEELVEEVKTASSFAFKGFGG
jgi:hypothetical protein